MSEKEYIERGAALKVVSQIMCDVKVHHKHRAINRNIKQLPTADVQEVVHGNNKVNKSDEMYNGEHFICSECGIILDDILCVLYDEDFEELGTFDFECKYCPNCGAKMDKE